MRIHRLPLDKDPLLGQLAAFLRDIDVETAARFVRREGDWFGDISAGVPAADRPLSTHQTCGILTGLQRRVEDLLPFDVAARAVIYYPASGGMGWHTNSNRPGWRVYVPRLFGGASGMVTGEDVVADEEGFANAFRIDDWSSSWHAVYALTPRLSAGILITDERAQLWGLQHDAN